MAILKNVSLGCWCQYNASLAILWNFASLGHAANRTFAIVFKKV